ncbi:MAG: hypothetical protein JWO31_192, partial [Phycisphaerales bacterium]|nr:hypothetical protein [Phycisphaerales bacterium]
MRLVTCQNGTLSALPALSLRARADRAFRTGLAAIDALAPDGAFALGAVHEVLGDPADGAPQSFALLLARAAAAASTDGGEAVAGGGSAAGGGAILGGRVVVWSD